MWSLASIFFRTWKAPAALLELSDQTKFVEAFPIQLDDNLEFIDLQAVIQLLDPDRHLPDQIPPTSPSSILWVESREIASTLTSFTISKEDSEAAVQLSAILCIADYFEFLMSDSLNSASLSSLAADFRLAAKSSLEKYHVALTVNPVISNDQGWLDFKASALGSAVRSVSAYHAVKQVAEEPRLCAAALAVALNLPKAPPPPPPTPVHAPGMGAHQAKRPRKAKGSSTANDPSGGMFQLRSSVANSVTSNSLGSSANPFLNRLSASLNQVSGASPVPAPSTSPQTSRLQSISDHRPLQTPSIMAFPFGRQNSGGGDVSYPMQPAFESALGKGLVESVDWLWFSSLADGPIVQGSPGSGFHLSPTGSTSRPVPLSSSSGSSLTALVCAQTFHLPSITSMLFLAASMGPDRALMHQCAGRLVVLSEFIRSQRVAKNLDTAKTSLVLKDASNQCRVEVQKSVPLSMCLAVGPRRFGGFNAVAAGLSVVSLQLHTRILGCIGLSPHHSGCSSSQHRKYCQLH